MASNERFCINGSKITHQTIEGEVLIVDLGTGSYYSLDGAGADTWSCLDKGATIGEIVLYLSKRFKGELGEISTAIQKLIAELSAEGLVLQMPEAGEGKSPESGDMATQNALAGTMTQFTPPILNKYTDMQDLLRLDPIHDVNETGWPSSKLDRPEEEQQK